MVFYNPLIKETKALFEGKACQSWAPGEKWNDLGSSELVLQKDAAYELGASGKGSANYILYTSSSELVPKDEIILYGKDLQEIRSDCDFARIIIVRVGVMDYEDEVLYRTLKDIEFAKYHVHPEGYMLRMSPETYREQVRVSKTAVKRGIDFHKLGSNYIAAYKENPNVVSVQVIFTTDPTVNYGKMKEFGKKAGDITGTFTHILEGLPTDCSVCALKDVCDEVDGMKELHFGIGEQGSAHKH